jgi:hypothetical protein
MSLVFFCVPQIRKLGDLSFFTDSNAFESGELYSTLEIVPDCDSCTNCTDVTVVPTAQRSQLRHIRGAAALLVGSESSPVDPTGSAPNRCPQKFEQLWKTKRALNKLESSCALEH